MAKLTFPGGIQLSSEKELTKDASFINLFPEGELVFPLSQHIGEPAIPVVKEGDFVRMGQVIARADGRLSAPIHAPVSGQITAVEDRLTADGTQARSIVLENDGLYLEIPYPPNRHIYSLRREEILAGIRSAGITGLGGASLPSAVKIEEADPESVDFCIANCMESEPYLTAGYRRLVESPWKVINGLRIVLRMFPKARGVIALPSGYADCAAQLRELTAQMPHVQVRVLPDKYPQGAERQLIYAITGRTLNRTMLPHDIGCIVYNLDTLVAINQACITNEPLMTRTLTLSGRAAEAPGNYRVRLGMSCREFLEQAGGLKEGYTEEDVLFLDGGPMMGRPYASLDVPVTKLTRGLICIPRHELPSVRTSACIRCGRCAGVCPNRLTPFRLLRDLEKEKDDRFIAHGGLECSGCGACTYICPAGLSLSDRIDEYREKLLKDPEKTGDYARRYIRR